MIVGATFEKYIIHFVGMQIKLCPQPLCHESINYNYIGTWTPKKETR